MKKLLISLFVLALLLATSQAQAAQGWSGLGDTSLGAGIITYDGSGGFSAAVDGTDYLAPARVDDTKGNGDTGYVYSADKAYDENVKTRGLHEAIAAGTDPFAITPTGGWTAALRFDFWITDTTDGGDVSLTETGPPADGTIAVLHNAGANTIEIPNADGNLEVPNDGTIVLETYEAYAVVYRTDRWVPLDDKSTANFATLTTVETEFIPVGWMIDGTVAPAVAATLSSTNKVSRRDFDGAANEDLKFVWDVPADIDAASGIKFAVLCYVVNATAPANTQVVAFSLAGMALANSAILSGAVGSAQTSSLTADATYVQYDRLQTTFSSAVVVTNLADSLTAHFNLIRLATTTDTYAQDIGVAGIILKYKRFHDATF